MTCRVRCPHRGDEAHPQRRGPPSGVAQPVGPRSGVGVVPWRTRPLAGSSSWLIPGLAAGLCPGGRGLRPGVSSRSVAGPAAGRPGRRGRPAGWSRVRRRGSVQADARLWRDARPIGPGSGGGVPSRRTRSPAFVGDIQPVGPRPGAGVRLGGRLASGRTPSRSVAGLVAGFRLGRCLAFGVTPDPSAPGPAAGFPPGGRGAPGWCPPSELSRTESPALARRGSAGPESRALARRGFAGSRAPYRLVGALPEWPSGSARTVVGGRRPGSRSSGPGRSRHGHRPRSRRLLRGDPAPPRPTPSRPSATP